MYTYYVFYWDYKPDILSILYWRKYSDHLLEENVILKMTHPHKCAADQLELIVTALYRNTLYSIG